MPKSERDRELLRRRRRREKRLKVRRRGQQSNAQTGQAGPARPEASASSLPARQTTGEQEAIA
jgi:hypothetical protein